MKSKLFNIRCDNCGAEYRINSRGEMNCPFCGSKIYLNDKDFEEYQKTRDEMLVKDRVDNDLINSDGDVLHKWFSDSYINFRSLTGKVISCKFVYREEHDDKVVYIGRNRISIVYNTNLISDVEDAINSIQYPSADIKGLEKYIPEIVFTSEIIDDYGQHRFLVVINKPENIYPLSMIHGLDPKQVAWMISRMENLGCLFEFNRCDFGVLSVNDFYFNPKTHEIHLLDGWEHLQQDTAPRNYLKSIRVISTGVMNEHLANKACLDFLAQEPCDTAYDDFKAWDDVIEHGFNGHKFHHFSEAEW